MAETLAERFWSRVDQTAACWLWTGHVSSRGYGYIRCGGKKLAVHRFAYELLVGPIPERLVIDHLCRVRRCVNPSHMEPVTHRENILRGEGWGAKLARRSHCKNGHEFTPENTHRRANRMSRRECKTCDRLHSAAYRDRNRAMLRDRERERRRKARQP